MHASVVVTGGPKTARGRRVLPLPEKLVGALRTLSVRQASERAVAGAAYEDNGLVVIDELGRPVRPERYTDDFRRHAHKAACPTSGCTTPGTRLPR